MGLHFSYQEGSRREQSGLAHLKAFLPLGLFSVNIQIFLD